MAKTKAQIEKEFNEFAEKIAKLEGLKHELEGLDAKGFETDVKLIKAKLKDIRAIPSIKRDIDLLRGKIEHKKTAVLSADGFKRRIAHLEKLIVSKKLAGKKQLSKEEVKEVRDIPKLERELSALKKGFEQHMAGRKVKVDSGVGILVDAKFDDFVASLKGNLTEKLRQKEKELGEKEALELKSDLDKRKEMFNEKFSELEAERISELNKKKLLLEKKTAEMIKKHHEMYKQKVQNELENEIRNNFNEKLREKLNAIKQKTISETKKRFLNGLMRTKAKELNKIVKEKTRKVDFMTRKAIGEMKKRMHNEMISNVQREVREKERGLRKKLDREYNAKVKSSMKVKEAELAKKKAQLEAFVASQAKKLFR